MHLNDCVVY